MRPTWDELRILDGGLASELERRGADLLDPLWSAKLLIEDPRLIREVHIDYLRAGADIITTATYQASFPGFAERGIPHDEALKLFRLAVNLAKEARNEVGRPALIAGSLGCYGASLHNGAEYRGDYGLSAEALADWHRPRWETLLDAGVDVLACETVPCVVEAEALAKLLNEYPESSAWIAFSCSDERHLCHGESLAEAIHVIDSRPNCIAVGVNCTAPHLISPLLDSVHGNTKPFVVYPNLGETWNATEHRWGSVPRQFEWAFGACEWFARGARILGGCCRTTPDTIRAIATALKHGD